MYIIYYTESMTYVHTSKTGCTSLLVVCGRQLEILEYKFIDYYI